MGCVSALTGLDALAREQTPEGSWRGDYSGPLFLLPWFVAAAEATAPFDPDTADGLARGLVEVQNPDGGWGLGIETPSCVLTSVGGYAALRMLGRSVDDPACRRAREWFRPHGGGLGCGAWGRYLLAVLGLQPWSSVPPVPPEAWLLPEALPMHPSRWWCHTRAVYLPLSWLWATRATLPSTPLLRELAAEVHPPGPIDWRLWRENVAAPDRIAPRHPAVTWANRAARLAEPALRLARPRALERVLDHIAHEDAATEYVCIGPVNKAMHTLLWALHRPGGPEATAHRERLELYLHRDGDAVRVNGYESSEVWDTAFAVQAAVAAGGHSLVDGGARYLEASQVRRDPPDRERHHRIRTQGGWTFSTRRSGWTVSDCTAEALTACLHAEAGPPTERLADAVDRILEQQNADGSWSSYEPIRGPAWLEVLNPSDVFADIMVDHPHVECTASCIVGLCAWRDRHGSSEAIDAAVKAGVAHLRTRQRPDGAFEGFWAACFTYGTWHAVRGLRAAGVPATDPQFVRAAAFLLDHQSADGGWGEALASCRERRWIHAESHAVQTAWAVLALVALDADRWAIDRGATYMASLQRLDGTWPRQRTIGVFNRTCSIHYSAYRQVFPAWALARVAATAAERPVALGA
ncbi:MAG: squalene/oxidosqualene cyclase-like protein [Myxococcota bacterium]|jgi:squalene/oxidosqualene cyclase-like protein